MNFDHLSSFPNSHDYTYTDYTDNVEHHPLSLPNTGLPMLSLGVNNGMSNVGEVGGSNVSHLLRSKPRGRPRGSKNKPKENVLNKTSIIESVVLEIPPGVDIVKWLGQFAHSRKVSVHVLGGSGLLSEVAINLGTKPHPVIFSEHLTLISFSGFSCMFSPSEPSASWTFTATMGRMNGTTMGGPVYSLVTMGPVVLTTIISNNTEFIGGDFMSLA